MTTNVKENMIKEMGIDARTIKGLNTWLTVERAKEVNNAFEQWVEIGKVCSQIKALKVGKFKDNCEIVFPGLINDERQYSMKLADNADAIRKWFKETNCKKYNPRTIYTAYDNFINPKKKKTGEEKSEVEEVEDKELRKERKGVDAIKALVEYRRIRNNAAENGNLLLGDLETLRTELENELKEICEAIELEAPVKPAKGKKAEKKAA